MTAQVSERRDETRTGRAWRPDRIQVALLGWSALFVMAAAVWLVRPEWWWMGTNAPDSLSLLAELDPVTATPVVFGIALASVAVAVAMHMGAGVRRDVVRRGLAAFGLVLAVVLLVAVPDANVLALLGYLPAALALAPFNQEMRTALLDALNGPLLLQVAALLGGVLWGLASVRYLRSVGPSCGGCGRGESEPAWAQPASAARWGRVAVYVAVTVPVLYAVTRYAWALEIPLGVSEEFIAAGSASGQLWAGVWLGTFGVLGAVLTLGLVQRWGEVFPAWLPGLAGRRVPIRLATIPASVVAVALIPAGIAFVRSTFRDELGALSSAGWATYAPTLLFPVWGIALGAAAYAYHLRRRGNCRACGRG